MKKLLVILFLFVLFSCEKQDIHCWICETKLNEEIISSVTVCGMNEEEMFNFQQGLETQSTALLNELTKVTCKIKR